jgi:Rad3-related DNA helicase
MGEAILDVFTGGGHLMVEAPPGIGKTFAYLVPAVASGRTVVISTGTRTLQDQLFQRDIPMISRALDRPIRAALMKGRENYLCIQRLEAASSQEGLPGGGLDADALADVGEDRRPLGYLSRAALSPVRSLLPDQDAEACPGGGPDRGEPPPPPQ